MRIIAGVHRGRKLLPPESDTTRPVTDRVKQSVFDILSPLIDGAIVYDCFAGTGSMGLECLSRGAKHVTFFENDPSACRRLTTNVRTLGMTDRIAIVKLDLLRPVYSAAGKGRKANLIFLDPPYRYLRDCPVDLRRLAEQLATDLDPINGLLIFRHDAADSLSLPSLFRSDVRTYGSMTVEFLCRLQQNTRDTLPATDD